MKCRWASILLVTATLISFPGSACAELPHTIERLKPSVVVVGLANPLKSPSFEMRGSGFAVGDGLTIATNAHVVPEAGSIDTGSTLAVLIPLAKTQKIRPARLVARDIDHDLALLRIEPPALPALALSPNPAREGQGIAFMGFPLGGALGFSPVTHRGIISSITPIVQPSPQSQQLNDTAIRRLRAGAFPIYQLDATAYPGNSGGPLFAPESGEVLGVINMVFVKEGRESALTKPSGISYAIPAEHLAALLSQIQQERRKE